jgi:hypothetical protein
MSVLRLALLILLAFSPLSALAPLATEMHDYRVEYVLHAAPAETQILSVVAAPNIVFDQPMFQMPDPETSLQLFAAQCFWDIKNEIHQNEVSLCVQCTLTPERTASMRVEYPTVHFLFLTPNISRDKRITQVLQCQSLSSVTQNGKTTYEFPRSNFLCVAKPGLIVYTNNRLLMRTVLSRMDAWWLKRIAMPGNLDEWNYVNQKAPYWGIRHFPSNDTTSPVFAANTAMFDSRPVGMTFEYRDNSHDLNMTYISNNAEQRFLRSGLIKDADPWTSQHIFVKAIDNHASRITVSDSRCLSIGVYSVLEWFNPPFAIEVEKLRRRHSAHITS